MGGDHFPFQKLEYLAGHLGVTQSFIVMDKINLVEPSAFNLNSGSVSIAGCSTPGCWRCHQKGKLPVPLLRTAQRGQERGCFDGGKKGIVVTFTVLRHDSSSTSRHGGTQVLTRRTCCCAHSPRRSINAFPHAPGSLHRRRYREWLVRSSLCRMMQPVCRQQRSSTSTGTSTLPAARDFETTRTRQVVSPEQG